MKRKRNGLWSPMATREPIMELFGAENGETDEEDEKWITHYSSKHQILLVGEGDFSFSLSLANAFASANNICATSLDSYDVLKRKYKNAVSNLVNLRKLGATLLHGVDVATMKLHTSLADREFDRIIFNFPHAGFYGKEDNPHMIGLHQELVHNFFWNAERMLQRDGEIHVNHKTSPPYCLWNLEELASDCSLALIHRVDFNIQDYPGYQNKRGFGSDCDVPFRLGECSTFKFGLCPRSKEVARATPRPGFSEKSWHFETIPMPMQLQPTSGFNYPLRNHIVNHIPTVTDGNRYYEVLRDLIRTYGQDCYGVACPERLWSGFDARYYGLGTVRHGFDRQMLEVPRTLNGNLHYVNQHEHEPHHITDSRPYPRRPLECQAYPASATKRGRILLL